MSAALEVRCANCRGALAALVPDGHNYTPKGKYRPRVLIVRDPADPEGEVRLPRCEKCYLWRGDFTGRLPKVRAAAAKETPGRVPDMLAVAWTELRKPYFDALAKRSVVTVKVTDHGRVIL